MKNVLKCLKKIDWLFVVLAIGLIVVQVWLDLKMPDYTAKLSTAAASGGVTMKDVWANGGMMLLCAFGSLASAILCSFLLSRVSSSISKQLKEKMFGKISSFSSAEMKKFSTPSLITRTTNDVSQIQMFVAMGLQFLIKAPVLAIWAICKISSTSVEWTVATFICVAIIVICVGLIVGLCISKFKKAQKLVDNLNNATRENVSGVRVVRAFNAEEYQEKKFEKANYELTKNHLYTSKVTGIMSPVMTICMNGLTLAIYWIGAYLVNKAPIIEREIVIGNMTAFTQYALQVVMAFMMLIMIFIILPRAIVSMKRINEVLNTELSMKNGFGGQNQNDVKGKVEFKDVSFSYFDGTDDAISNISFVANQGETVALIGATGCGKTTIIDLIPRFNDVTSGEILVDDVNVKDYDFEQLQDKIAVVSQKAILFKGDIKENITYGSKEQITDEDPRIQKALEIASADFVNKLEKGIHSEVAQGGTNFSGGQKQRLSIARAIFKDSEIIIFDDSFSALDYKTDKQVRENIKKELGDKTILIVAQRIGTIRNADKILVIDEGKIVGEGTHDYLIENCELYKEIALSQLSEEEL
ncbi:MAG: ABC transporter ATP-binding protein [Clostridiales bacterium]|nr:ABC transporter ATP-binding protein [Clostridiales bacterium]